MKRRNVILATIGLLLVLNIGGFWFLTKQDTDDTPIPTVAVLEAVEEDNTAVEVIAAPSVEAPISTVAVEEPAEIIEMIPPLQSRIRSSENPTVAPVSQQVTIVFQPDADNAARADYIQQIGGEIVQEIPQLNAVVVNVASNPTVIHALPQSPAIINSEPDYIVTALEIPNDEHYPEQWGLPLTNAPTAWDSLPVNGTSITIAVIDSGICYNHADLSGRILSNGRDYVEDDNVAQDEYGHGCAVAGVIAANGNNTIGIAGVAPNSQIMPLRVLDANGAGVYSDVAAALIYATDNGATVINLSLGAPFASTVLQNAVNYATSRGVTVVAAAGNSGTEGVYYPAAYPDVIAVGSADANGQRSSFSSYGAQLDTLAPGRNILSTHRNGAYSSFNGTSFAAPHVAGLVAISRATGIELVLSPDSIAHLALAVASSPTITPVPSLEPRAVPTQPVATPIVIEPIDGRVASVPLPIASRTPIPPLPDVAANNNPLFEASNMILSLEAIQQHQAVRSRAVTINMGALAPATNAFNSAQALTTHSITLNLFDDVTLQADLERLEARMTDDSGYVWVGRIQNEPLSDVVLVVGDNQITGSVLIPGRTFTIRPIAAGQHAVIEVNPRKEWGNDARIPPSGLLVNRQAQEVSNLSTQDNGNEIDLLVVYSTAAKNAAGGLDNLKAQVNAEIVLANNSFSFSSMGPTPFWLVGFYEQTDYTDLPTNTFDDDLNHISNFDGVMDDAFTWRENVQADLVIYVRETVNDNTCGLAWVMTEETVDFAESAFSVIARECFGDVTMVHEMGHNMGSVHDIAWAGFPGVFSYSYGYVNYVYDFYTLMAYPCSVSCRLLNRWSSPNQTDSVSGQPVGSSTANNVLSITNTRDTVSRFRLSIPKAPRNMGWLQDLTTPTSVTIFWQDESNNEEGFNIYRYDGIDWTYIGSVGQNVKQYTDTSVDCGFIYFYTVTAYRENPSIYVESDGADPAVGTATQPCNDLNANARVINPLPYTDTLVTFSATISMNDPNLSCTSSYTPNVWYRFTPAYSGTYEFNTFGSNYPTALAMYTGTYPSLTELECSDDVMFGGVRNSQIIRNLTAGQTYSLLVAEDDQFWGTLIFNAKLVQFADCNLVTDMPAAECVALVNLYNATGGTTWTDKTAWLDDINPCNWFGVTCVNGHVDSLSLPANGLSGALPISIGNLTSLKTLNLSNNALDGALPTGIGNLVNLLTLNLENTRLIGLVPTAITNLTALTSLNLSYNALYTDNTTVATFLTGEQAGWELTQTAPVTNAAGATFDTSTINLSWTAIPYTGDGGYYEIWYRRQNVQDFTLHGTTADKSATAYALNSLPVSNELYYIRIISYTAANNLKSVPVELSGRTAAVVPSATFTPSDTPIPTNTPEPNAKTIGLYDDGMWWFRDANASGDADLRFAFGPREDGWQPLSGDWNGDGIDGIGVYKDGLFILRDTTDAGVMNYQVNLGIFEPGWQAVVGDWNGDGRDSVGMYRNGIFLLTDDTVRRAVVQIQLRFDPFGAGLGVPVAGDWNNSSRDSIGLYYNGQFALKMGNTSQSPVISFTFGPLETGWLPLAGDWNGDGLDTIGVYRDGIWRLRNSNSAGLADEGFSFRAAGSPIANYRGTSLTLMALADSMFVDEIAPTATVAASATSTPTIEITAEVTVEVIVPSETPTIAEAATETATPTETVTPEPSATETPLPSDTPTPEMTEEGSL